MLPALKGFDRRLRRLAARIEALVPRIDAPAALAAGRQLVETTIRAGLARAGIDPEAIPALRRFTEPAPLPASAFDGPPADPRVILQARLERLARQAREDPPTLAECTPAMLLAMVCCNDGIAIAPG